MLVIVGVAVLSVVRVSTAPRGPAVVGLNVTGMVALPPAGIAGGRVPTRVNRAASAPVIVAPVIVTGAEPVLRTVTFCCGAGRAAHRPR